MFYLMLNTLSAPIDYLGFACGSSECNSSSSSSSTSNRELWGNDGYSTTTTSTASWTNDAHTSTASWTNDAHTSTSSWTNDAHTSTSASTCPERCHKAPHLHPPHPKPKSKPKNGGGSSSSSSSSTKWANDGHTDGWTNDGHSDDSVGWGDDGNGWGDDGNGKKSESSGGSWYDDDTYGGTGNGNGYGNVGNDDANKNEYLSSNSNGSGHASQVKGAKSMPVWPFLVAALTVGVVAAALMAKKRKKARQGNHALNGSIKRRMELFSGGLHRKEKPAAASPLYENDYENEPSFVEMRDPDDRS
jgi:hypothetical protein